MFVWQGAGEVKHGTLSSDVQGRFVVVWEGLLAYLPDTAARQRFRLYDRVGARGRALHEWRSDALARSALWDLAYRKSIPVDVVSTLGSGYARKLEKRIEREVHPVSGVTMFDSEDELDDFVRRAPYLIGAIHGFAQRPLLFGGKGLLVAPGQPWRL